MTELLFAALTGMMETVSRYIPVFTLIIFDDLNGRSGAAKGLLLAIAVPPVPPR